jgi:16S rRNA (cytosine1402-N4)-methyltransferase
MPQGTPLDSVLTAKDLLNNCSEKGLIDILKNYGEERFAKRIAGGIVEARKEKPIETTFELVEIIKKSVPAFYRNNRRINCCTKTFQALRIAVNDELDTIRKGIKEAWEKLDVGGRLVSVSFHSLEDRIVKNFYREMGKTGEGKILTKKPITASEEELVANPRSRSAKLRAMEKLATSH